MTNNFTADPEATYHIPLHILHPLTCVQTWSDGMSLRNRYGMQLFETLFEEARKGKDTMYGGLVSATERARYNTTLIP